MSRATRERAAKREKKLIGGVTPFVKWDRSFGRRIRVRNIAPVVATTKDGTPTRCGTLAFGANAAKRKRRASEKAQRAAEVARNRGRDRRDRREAIRANEAA